MESSLRARRSFTPSINPMGFHRRPAARLHENIYARGAMPRFVSQEVRLQARDISETIAFYTEVLGSPSTRCGDPKTTQKAASSITVTSTSCSTATTAASPR